MEFLRDKIAWLAAEFQMERGRWLLWAPVLIGCGAWAYFSWPDEPSRWWLPAAPLLALLCFAPPLKAARPGLVVLLLLAMGWNAAQLATMRVMHPMLRHEIGPLRIEGRVVEIEPSVSGVSVRLDDVKIDRLMAGAPRQVRIRLRDQSAEWPPPGSIVAIDALLAPPQEPVAPGAYDFRRHAFFDGIGAQGFARGSLSVVAPPKEDGGFMLWVESVRETIAERVLRVLSGDQAQIAIALLNGAQSGISKPALADMRASGLQHILSISGLHLAIVAAFVYVGLRSLLALIPYVALRWPIKKIAAGLSLVNLIVYTLLTGMLVPAIRSAIMTGIIMIAVLFDRRALSLRTVAIAGIILLLAAPQALLGASFQMSFAAVLVMVAGFEELRRRRRLEIGRERVQGRAIGLWGAAVKIAEHIAAIATTSVLASVATAPVALYNFQQINWYGVIANMLGIPLATFWIMPAGFISYFLMPFGLEAWAIKLMGWGIDALMAIAAAVAAWPGALILTLALPSYAFALVLAGGLWLCLWTRRWRLFGLAPIAAGLALCLFPSAPDIYIAPDFANWAARVEQRKFVAARGGERDFILKQWRQREGGREFVTLKDYIAEPASPAAPSSSVLRCDDLGCVYAARTREAAFVFDAAALEEDCMTAAVIVTPLWHVNCPGSTAMIVDGRWVKRHGATSITLRENAPPEILSARDRWGARPWSPGWRTEERRWMADDK
ncbi:MAG: ComEC/Rec2 family competence protein [Alphaproteobacteria bacterium]